MQETHIYSATHHTLGLSYGIYILSLEVTDAARKFAHLYLQIGNHKRRNYKSETSLTKPNTGEINMSLRTIIHHKLVNKFET